MEVVLDIDPMDNRVKSNLPVEVSEIICAISTPPGIGAIATIRLSGKGSIALVDKIFSSPSNRKLSTAEANKLFFGRIIDDGELLDEVLVTLFHSPRSYTGEESVEISCHGSPYIQQKLMELLISKGARLAKPVNLPAALFTMANLTLVRLKLLPI